MQVRRLFLFICNLVACCLAENDNVTFENVTVALSGSCYFSDFKEHNFTISHSNNLAEALAYYPLGRCIEIVHQSIPVIYKDALSNIHNGERLDITSCGIRDIQPGAFEKSSIKQMYIEENKELETVKRGVFNLEPGLISLSLRRNGIKYIEKGAFEYLPDLYLSLMSNQLEEVPVDVFSNTSLRHLDLSTNKIRKILKGAFSNNPLLSFLILQDNMITDIEPGAFANTPNLTKLYLSNNRLTQISYGILGVGERKSMDLILEYNNIKLIEPRTFENYSFQLLALSHNKLEELKSEAFSGSKIEELLLSDNTIKYIHELSFSNGNLSTIDLGKNKLRIIRKGTFRQRDICIVNLYDNDIEKIEADAFNTVLLGVFVQDAKLDVASKTYINSLGNVYVNGNYFRVTRYYLH